MKLEYGQEIVLKVGGSVLSNLYELCKTAKIIKDLSTKYTIKAVVVSAMGKTTSNLEDIARYVSRRPRPTPCELDALRATGEMQSAPLLAMRLNKIGVHAESYNAYQAGIITDDKYGNANIKNITFQYFQPMPDVIPIVAGYQGITGNGKLTTLGHEGSDFTAMWFASVLCANVCVFLKDSCGRDIGGIFDKNPAAPDAKLLDVVSCTQLLKLMRENKSHVLHRKSLDFAKDSNVTSFVAGTENPTVGTLVVPYLRAKSH